MIALSCASLTGLDYISQNSFPPMFQVSVGYERDIVSRELEEGIVVAAVCSMGSGRWSWSCLLFLLDLPSVSLQPGPSVYVFGIMRQGPSFYRIPSSTRSEGTKKDMGVILPTWGSSSCLWGSSLHSGASLSVCLWTSGSNSSGENSLVEPT